MIELCNSKDLDLNSIAQSRSRTQSPVCRDTAMLQKEVPENQAAKRPGITCL